MAEYIKKQELLNDTKVYKDDDGVVKTRKLNFRNYIESLQSVNAIPISDNATLGDVIEAMLPNAEIGPDPSYKPSVDIYIGGTLMMRVDRNLWNAPYRAISEGK